MIVDDNERESESNNFADFEAKVEAGGESATPEADEDEQDADESGESEEGDEQGTDESGESEEGEQPKPEKSAKDRIRELNRKYRAEQAARETDRKGFEARIDALEGKKPLTQENDSGSEADEAVAPNPKDFEKYPLGALDDAYIQDAIDFRATQAAKQMVDSLLQRQEQSEEEAAAEAFIAEVRSQALSLAEKGAELHSDFEDVVLPPAMGGKADYDLTQITFEAVAEAENGAQILYDLALDPAEATRVAQLSPIQQLKFVAARDAELSKGTAKAKLPGAKPPPAQVPRGGSARTTISPATTNFAEFEALANSKS